MIIKYLSTILSKQSLLNQLKSNYLHNEFIVMKIIQRFSKFNNNDDNEN